MSSLGGLDDMRGLKDVCITVERSGTGAGVVSGASCKSVQSLSPNIKTPPHPPNIKTDFRGFGFYIRGVLGASGYGSDWQ